MAIRKLTPDPVVTIWGSQLTQPWLANPDGRQIGEVWISAPEIPSLLVKFLFTSDKLSVQVHPDDDYARAHGRERGKTEMWHILRTEPKAKIALGLRQPATKDDIRAGALDGTIMDMLEWIPAQAGDTFFVPAGTIHAIGGGLALCEIQQHSDATYRLFDHNRKPERELHIEHALAVARLEPADGRRHATRVGNGRELLAECDYFRAERLTVQSSAECPPSPQTRIYVAISGEGTIAGEPFQAGEAWLAHQDTPTFSIETPNGTFIVASPISSASDL